MKRIIALLLTLAAFAGVPVSFAAASDDAELQEWVKDATADSMAKLQAKAESGNGNAQLYLGLMYLNGRGVPRDFIEAVKWMRKAAEQGHALAQHTLATVYGVGGTGVPKDTVEAAKWMRKAAEHGHVDAQLILGWKSLKGDGMPQDESEASKWFRMAAEQGHAVAQYWLGNILLGHEDYPEARKWLRKAAEQGHANAQYLLGKILEDLTEERKWLRKAAEQGHADAQYWLGRSYYGSQGAPKDFPAAMKWFRMAAEQGHALACRLVGQMYTIGQGVPRDEIEGLAWAWVSSSIEQTSARPTNSSLGPTGMLAVERRSKQILNEIEATVRARNSPTR